MCSSSHVRRRLLRAQRRPAQPHLALMRRKMSTIASMMGTRWMAATVSRRPLPRLFQGAIAAKATVARALQRLQQILVLHHFHSVRFLVRRLKMSWMRSNRSENPTVRSQLSARMPRWGQQALQDPMTAVHEQGLMMSLILPMGFGNGCYQKRRAGKSPKV